jgi:sporulation protein YlmC with PRC-barrel domain
MELGEMQIEYGADVVDRNGTFLGSVNYVVRNTWTGEISKFMVQLKQSSKNLFFSPEDVVELTKSKIRLNIPSEELGCKSED